ncbi:MAG: DUF1353 domain-containing protein [Candidatus Omnitrophota bacterium]|jgi:hypothetical protein
MDKAGFRTALDVRLRDDCDNIWVVRSPLKYWSELLNRLIIVPPWFETVSEATTTDLPCFETDLASVPRLPLIYDMWGSRAHREAILHDAMYRTDFPGNISYSQANSVFLEAMESTGKPWYIRYPMYWGVVLGGASSYHKKGIRDKL